MSCDLFQANNKIICFSFLKPIFRFRLTSFLFSLILYFVTKPGGGKWGRFLFARAQLTTESEGFKFSFHIAFYILAIYDPLQGGMIYNKKGKRVACPVWRWQSALFQLQPQTGPRIWVTRRQKSFIFEYSLNIIISLFVYSDISRGLRRDRGVYPGWGRNWTTIVFTCAIVHCPHPQCKLYTLIFKKVFTKIFRHITRPNLCLICKPSVKSLIL